MGIAVLEVKSRWWKFSAVLLGLAPLNSVDGQSAIPSAPVSAEAAGIDAVIRSEMGKRAIPGMQVAIVRSGKLVFSKAYGLADLEARTPVTRSTVFSLNSATKSFTGVAIMQLVEAGKLSLDAPASRYLSDLPPAWQMITLRQFLTHSSGVPDIIIQPKGQGTGSLVGEGGEISAWSTVKTLPVDFAPGSRFRYNQTNYVVLGKIIDRVSLMPFAAFIKQGQFDASAMSNAVFGDARDVIPGRTRTYRYTGGQVGPSASVPGLEHAFDDFTPIIRTAGGLNATAEDVARWIIGLQSGTLLRPAGLAEMWTPARFNDGTATPWGMGWPLNRRAEHPHVAGIGGRRSAFFIYPKDDLAIVVLTNLAGSTPEEFIDEIAGQFYPDLRAANGGGLPPAIRQLRAELIARGFPTATATYARLKRKDARFSVSESELNSWGGRLMREGNPAGAIEVFKLNTQLHPDSANAHDSLAEGYEATNDTPLAIASYRRSLVLDPENDHARDRLKAIQ